MKPYLLIALAILAVSSSAHVIRDAPSEEREHFLDTIHVGLSELQRTLFETVGLTTDIDELKTKVGENIGGLTKQFGLLTAKLLEKADKIQHNGVVRELRETVCNHVEAVNDFISKKFNVLAHSENVERLKETTTVIIHDTKEDLEGLVKELTGGDKKRSVKFATGHPKTYNELKQQVETVKDLISGKIDILVKSQHVESIKETTTIFVEHTMEALEGLFKELTHVDKQNSTI